MSSLRKAIGFTLALVLMLAIVASGTPGQIFAAQAPSQFIIGVWSQPISDNQHGDNFAFFKSLGVNTLVGYDAGPTIPVSMSDWDAKAAAYGLKVIRKPSGNVAYDAQQYNRGTLIAWMHGDESDKLAANSGKWNDSTLNTAILNNAALWRAQAPNIPLYSNFMGSQFGYQRDAWYQQAVQQGTDFYGFDWYPLNNNYPVSLAMVQRTQTIQSWTGKYPLIYIETSDQHLNNYAPKTPRELGMRGPTPEEIKGEMAISVALGAPGIVFFPQKIGGKFKYDNTESAAYDVIKEETKKWSLLDANPGTAIANLPAGLVGRIRNYSGRQIEVIANYTQDKTIVYGGKTYLPLGYTSKVLGGVSRDVPPTQKNPQPNSQQNPPSTSNQTPTVIAQTQSATAITTTSAIIHGSINPGTIKGVTWFEYGYVQGKTFGETWPYKAGVKGVAANTTVPIEASLTHLLPGKTYHYRIMVETAVGKKYGETLSFTTPQ